MSMLTWTASCPLHVGFNFGSALCMIPCDLLGEDESCNAYEGASLVSVVALGRLVYYLLSLPSTINSLLVVNETRGLQIPAVVASENAPLTWPA